MCTDIAHVGAALQDPERQKECEELLGPIGDDKFTYLKDVGRLITDYSQPDEEPGVPGDALDDDIGVAVEFEGEDADEESEVDEVEVRLIMKPQTATWHIVLFTPHSYEDMPCCSCTLFMQ